MLYLVSYDLKNGAPEDYQELYALFDEFPDHKKCLESSWLIESNLTCVQIREKLRTKMGDGDYLVVVPYGPTRASWLPNNVIEWIRKYLP